MITFEQILRSIVSGAETGMTALGYYFAFVAIMAIGIFLLTPIFVIWARLWYWHEYGR